MLKITLEGLITYDSGVKIFKPEGKTEEYPWRQIKICVPGNSVDFTVSVYPDEEMKAGENVSLDCVLTAIQKGLSSGAIVVNLKLQSEILYNSKAK